MTPDDEMIAGCGIGDGAVMVHPNRDYAPAQLRHILDTTEAARSDRGVCIYGGATGGGKSFARELATEAPATEGLRGKSLRRAEKKQRRLERQLRLQLVA